MIAMMPLKVWLMEEASRLRCSKHALEMRIWRGKTRLPRLKRINSRVIMVVQGKR